MAQCFSCCGLWSTEEWSTSSMCKHLNPGGPSASQHVGNTEVVFSWSAEWVLSSQLSGNSSKVWTAHLGQFRGFLICYMASEAISNTHVSSFMYNSFIFHGIQVTSSCLQEKSGWQSGSLSCPTDLFGVLALKIKCSPICACPDMLTPPFGLSAGHGNHNVYLKPSRAAEKLRVRS